MDSDWDNGSYSENNSHHEIYGHIQTGANSYHKGPRTLRNGEGKYCGILKDTRATDNSILSLIMLSR